jgi:hypothetical protein
MKAARKPYQFKPWRRMSPTHADIHPLARRPGQRSRPAGDEVRVLTCEWIWFDPAPHTADRTTLDVDIDPSAPERYLVDTSLLPRSAG